MIPLMAIIGGGVDTARGYLAKERLQQACDAGSLAGRRAMSNGELTALVRSETAKFIDFNFPQESYKTAAFTPNLSTPDPSTLAISIDTSLPTTIMALFGYHRIPLHVECEASQNFINTDVMLVLDTTGSMDDKVNGVKKIVALREAVMALYNQLKPIQTQLESHQMRLRYGIVPYSSTVNVGKLLPTSYIRTSTPYLVESCKGKNCSYTNTVRDVSAYVTGSSKSLWGGCIEERATVSTITGSSNYSVPANALDLNLSLVPSGNASSTSKWPPYLPDLQAGKSQSACPTEATRLKTFATASDMQTAVNKLTPDGGTYHDIGMIWGGRFLARDGIFAADNPATYNGMRVNRHVIFMTDGILDTGATLYSAYGVEQYQGRVSGGYSTKADLNARHRKRFQIMCNELKGQPDVTIWVIGFDTTMSSELTECASSPDKAVSTTNRDELIDQFTLIGKNIGALRLSQ